MAALARSSGPFASFPKQSPFAVHLSYGKRLLATSAKPPGPPSLKSRVAPKPNLEGIKHIVAVASGKGGVGKSTVAANLALALAELGQRVGLMDADIYGPSIHRMMNLKGKPEVAASGQLVPMENHGVKCMSMGNIVAEDRATIWRGPMVMGAVEQLLRDVRWAPLDVLVLDMPPGTGDAHLTIAQRTPLAGAVVVSTPQDIALIDARRAIAMFRTVNVPILGLVENMSFYECPKCHDKAYLFGREGAQRTAKEFNVQMLGAIPLQESIMTACESGAPTVIRDPTSAPARAFVEIARKLLETLKERENAPAASGPTISIE